MVDFVNDELPHIARQVAEDGMIDSEETLALRRRLLDDHEIDQDEAEFLFNINDAVSAQENSEEWEDFFIEAITTFVLSDDLSPNVLDEFEWDWLQAMIGDDLDLDELEEDLLLNIAEVAESVPAGFMDYFAKWQETEVDNADDGFFLNRIGRAVQNKIRNKVEGA